MWTKILKIGVNCGGDARVQAGEKLWKLSQLGLY